MPELDNAGLAGRLEEFAALLELAGANSYAARAYRRAAELIRALPLPVAELIREGRVRELRGIGPSIETKLRELVETGELAEARELRQEVSLELAAAGRLLGLGAERAVAIGKALGIRTLDELREASAHGRLQTVPGIGEKTAAKIAAALARDPGPEALRPLPLPQARELTARIAAGVGGEGAGDQRRWHDANTAFAVVVATDSPEAARRRFAALPEIVSLVAPDVGITREGVPIQLVVTEPAAFGTALLRATGPPEYVASLEPLPAAPDEETLYRLLGRPFTPPELRGSRRWIAAERLLQTSDLRGDLHAHTTWSDGRASVLELGQAARERGYEYLAICDHTPNVRVVPGLDADALRRQGEEIAAANELLAPFRLLRGVECDIRSDGSLDLPDDVLAELDWVQLSLHAGQRAAAGELTKKVTEAMRHPAVRCLSHPTGRIIGHRPPNALDLDRTFEVALETGVALEVNGLPDRLDLSGEHVARALEAGVKIVCSTDTHSIAGLGHIELSVRTARRGGATAEDVLNTRPLAEVLARR